MSDIKLYYTTDSVDTINKDLTAIGTITSTYYIRDTSLFAPEVDVDSNLDVANCNIFELEGRFYHVTDCKLLKGSIYRLNGELDAYTYKDGLLESRCVIDRTSDSTYINKNVVNPDKVNETRTYEKIVNLANPVDEFLVEPVMILTTIASNNPMTYTDPDFENDRIYGVYITLCNLLGITPNWYDNGGEE